MPPTPRRLALFACWLLGATPVGAQSPVADPPARRADYLALFSSAALPPGAGAGFALTWSLHYRGAMPHAAFAYAMGPDNRAVWSFVGAQPSAEAARGTALARCNREAATLLPGTECRLLAVDGLPEPGTPRAGRGTPLRDATLGPFSYAPLMWVHGPSAARGVIVWGHGYSGADRDSRGSALPGFLGALNDSGWDILRHDRAPAEDHLAMTLPRLTAALPALRAAGYRRVVLGGHSRGGWQSLRAAIEQPELVDGVLAAAPAAHGEVGETPGEGGAATGPRPELALEDFRRALAGLPVDRVALAVLLFDEDRFDPDPAARGAAVASLAARRTAPTLALWPEHARGHEAANTWRVTRDVAPCLLSLLNGPPAAAPRGVRRTPCGGG